MVHNKRRRQTRLRNINLGFYGGKHQRGPLFKAIMNDLEGRIVQGGSGKRRRRRTQNGGILPFLPLMSPIAATALSTLGGIFK